MRKVVIAAAALIALSSPSAFGQSVNTDFDPSYNFANVKTYFWAKTSNITPNQLADGRIIAAVDKWLQAAGWQKAEGSGDIAIVPNVSTQESKSLNTFYSGGYGGWGYGGWGGMGMGSASTTVSTFVEGTMVIDLFDAASKKLVWRGIAKDTLSDKPQNNAKKIDKAAEKMFKDKKKFPPKPRT
jgi:hypothetical protein